MMTRTVTSVVVMAALGLLAPINANAFGLGKLELSSALNEPFKAEIAITALNPDEADNFQVRLASSKEFEQAGIERNFLLTLLKFEVVVMSGNAKIVISSQSPIREPFIDFLLTATTTGSGRLIREYTVLLDPPTNVFKKSAEPVVNKTSTTSATNSFQYPSTSVSTTTNDSSLSSVDSYGPTNRKDTLWDVALKTRPETSISVHQMMIALLEANPRAFQHDNVNGLKAGYSLSIPSKENIHKLNKQQAIKAVQEQNQLWKNRNVRPTIIPEPADEIVTATSVVNPITDLDVAEKTNIPSNIEHNARLKLVAPNDKPSLKDDALSPLGSERIKDLSEQLTLAQETIEGQTQETIDFKARMDAMEEQMDTMRRLISLKDADLARLQSMLEQGEQPNENRTPKDSVVNESSELIEKGELVDTSAMTEQADDTSSVEKWESLIGKGSNIENADVLITSEVDITDTIQPKKDTTGEMVLDSTNVISPAVDNTDVLESDLQQFLATTKAFATKNIILAEKFVVKNKVEMLIAAGSLLLVLIGLLTFKRREKSNDTWDDTQALDNDDKASVVMPPESSDENTLTASHVIEVEQTPDTISTEKTVEELIEQADMLVAYTDYEQAMTILELAKQQEPTNQKILIKLLFVLFKQQQTEQFVTIASRLSIDKDSAEWTQIAEWGRELAPMNALFNLNAAIDNESVADLNLDSFSVAEGDEVEKNLIANEESSESEEPLSDTIDFNLDDYRSEDLVISDSSTSILDDKTSNNDELLSFDTSFSLDSENDNEGIDAPLRFENEANNDNSALSLNDEALSLDLNDESLEAEAIELISQDDGDLDNIQDLNVDLGAMSDDDNFGFDINGYDEIDEAETKLDLASAYADMGDPDGAKSILEEVLNEGNDEQKRKAQTLLDSL